MSRAQRSIFLTTAVLVTLRVFLPVKYAVIKGTRYLITYWPGIYYNPPETVNYPLTDLATTLLHVFGILVISAAALVISTSLKLTDRTCNRLRHGVRRLVIATLICLGSLAVTVATVTPEYLDTPGWTMTKRGNSRGPFTFTKDGTILYQGRKFQGEKARLDQMGLDLEEGLFFSPPSPDRNYILAVDAANVNSKVFILRLTDYTATELAIRAAPFLWVSWSPGNRYGLLARYYEADMSLHLVDLSDLSAKEIPISLAREGEEQGFELDSVGWKDHRDFSVTVRVNCNLYTSRSCDSDKRKQMLRRYRVQFDVVTFQGAVAEQTP